MSRLESSPLVGLLLHAPQGQCDGLRWWCNAHLPDAADHVVGRGAPLPDPGAFAIGSVLAGSAAGRYAVLQFDDSVAPTPAQLGEAAACYALGRRRYGWPIALADAPGLPGLLSHGVGGRDYNAHHACPGPELTAARAVILALAAELLGEGGFVAPRRFARPIP